MHPIAKKYFDLPNEKQRKVQIFLCEKALAVWECCVTTNRTYIETVAGTKQELEQVLPREAFYSVLEGQDNYSVSERYREPICALQDEDLVLEEPALSAYYAIYNLYVSTFIDREIDSWVIVNQAIASLGVENAIANLESAINETP